MNWDKIESAGDVSSYVKGIKSILTIHMNNIKSFLSDAYLIFYLNKLIIMINYKFINVVFKSKKINDAGLQQLQLDIYEIKMDLINLSKSEGDDKASSIFTNFVNKTISKSENILKLLSMRQNKFVENFMTFYEDATINDLEKMLNLKGWKKTDVPTLVKAISKI